ncbi:patatin-like phospholipase family protein [Litoribrevibacter euphylliae]|uniref:Patatin-like phospholipase family protein n=1 Tax=Litoribrevibacter euphylliae TaxID=1834034 RepID=A0ABV7HHA7_9GAMM
MRWNPFNTSIGLALGGGAAKGMAHIGVLKAFEEEGLTISYLSGTSIGSLVAAYYAFGKSLEEITEVGEQLTFKSLTSFSWRKTGGFFTTSAIREMIIRDLGDVQIEDAKIPLAICTTDIISGEQVAIEKGPLADAVCASVAVPGVFAPVEFNGRKLVDGGIVENVPISLLDDLGAGISVAVNLNGIKRYPEPDGMFDVVSNAIDICMDLKTRDQLKNADVVISLDLSTFNRTDNKDRVHELIEEGYRPTKEQISKVLWFKRTNYLHYLIDLIKRVIPLKIPELIKLPFKPKLPTIKIK